jgi:zinc protease
MRNRFYALLTLFLPFCASGQDLAAPVGLDSAVVTGKLANGVTYFVRENKKPEKRVELRLAIQAGSVLEDDDQRGLAHLLEHMAFNGTKDFKKHELIDYLESIGMSFGADLNAFTSFDKTVYMLQVPSDAEKVSKGIQILRNWADSLLLEGSEIDKERGVVIEEWRLRRGADQRMMDQQFPLLFHGSKYAQRLPIGTKEVLDTFTHERVRDFYKAWYRPDVLAVIAVGDFPADQLKAAIETQFGAIPTPQKPTLIPAVAVPDHDETLYALADDPEASSNSIGLLWKRDPQPNKTVEDFRRGLLEGLFASMLNMRLDEIREKPDAPFLRAGAGGGKWIKAKEFFNLNAEVKENGHLAGFKALLTEVERVRRHGFTEGEFKRALANMHRGFKKADQERDTTPSAFHAMGLVSHFTDNALFASAPRRLELFESLQA